MSFYSSAYVWFLQVHLELPTQRKEGCSDYAVLFTGKSNDMVVCIMEAKYNWTIHAAAQVCMLCPFESLTV